MLAAQPTPPSQPPVLQPGSNFNPQPQTAVPTQPDWTPTQGSYLDSRSSSPRFNFDGLGGVCDDCPTHGVMAFVSYDSFRGVADGGWQNNGIVSGLNYGTRLGRVQRLDGHRFSDRRQRGRVRLVGD